MSRRNPTQARSRASVDAILTAAAELLLREGFSRATTNRIAVRAGVSVGTLYQYFPDKVAVFDAVAERIFGEITALASRMGALPTAVPVQERLRQLIDGMIDILGRHPGLLRALDGVPSLRFQALLDAVRATAQRDLAAMLRAAGDDLTIDNPDETAEFLVFLADGIVRGSGPEADLGALADRLERHLHRVLGLRPTPPRGTAVHALPTPSLVLDPVRLDRNLARMAARAQDLGVTLRPHIKTAKSVAIAARAVGPGGPLTVSTLREAEHFARHGFLDLTLAVAVVPSVLDRLARLGARGCTVRAFVERAEVARAMAAHAGHFHGLVELDCGEDRTGVDADRDLLEIAQILHDAPRCRLHGVATHGGHSYGAASAAARSAVASDEREAACRAAALLRARGLPCPVVSVGSTPTAVHVDHLEGVTEMRPGVYALGDLFQAGIGSHGADDIACTVLATVLSHRRASNTLIIDAGGLALSKDRSTAGQAFDAGYGLLADAVSGAPLPGLKVVGVHQEHGIVAAAAPMPWARLPVGGRVRVLPNHICMTAAAHDRYHVVREGLLEEVWWRVNGWSEA